MSAVQDKKDKLRPLFKHLSDQPLETYKATERQRQSTKLKSQAIHKQTFQQKDRIFNEKIGQEKEKTRALHEENNLRQWLPPRLCFGAWAVMLVYFIILIFSGIKGNNFSLNPVVLSSIGVSAVGGSLALIGFIVQGLFRSQRKSEKDKEPKTG